MAVWYAKDKGCGSTPPRTPARAAAAALLPFPRCRGSQPRARARLYLFQGPELRANGAVNPSSPCRPRTERLFFTALHGRGGEEANFSALPELGQAEIVRWEPSEAGGRAGLTSLREAWGGSCPRSRPELKVCAFEVVPWASAACRRCGVAGPRRVAATQRLPGSWGRGTRAQTRRVKKA